MVQIGMDKIHLGADTSITVAASVSSTIKIQGRLIAKTCLSWPVNLTIFGLNDTNIAFSLTAVQKSNRSAFGDTKIAKLCPLDPLERANEPMVRTEF